MLKRFCFVLAIVLASVVSAHAQTTCRATYTLLGGDLLPLANVPVEVVRYESSTYTSAQRQIVGRTNSSGVLTGNDGSPGIPLIQGATYWIYASFSPFNLNAITGTKVQIPNETTWSLIDLPRTGATLTTLGDVPYAGPYGVLSRLAGNTTTSPKVLFSIGDGTAARAPAWWKISGNITLDATNKEIIVTGGGGGSSTTSYYYNTAATYTRSPSIAYISADATSLAQAINLDQTDGIPVEVYKSDTSANGVTITYGAATLTLRYAGSWAKFIPNGSSWVLWSLDPTSGGVAAAAGYVYFTTASYTVPSGVGYVDADATAQAQAVTLGTPNASAVEVRKSDTTTNAVTITYNASTLVLNSGGQAAKFVPYYNGTTTVWVLLSRTQ